jgi:hypothetical protein
MVKICYQKTPGRARGRAQNGEKPSVSQLCKQFEKAEAAYRAIPEVEEKPFERAVDRAVLLIAQTPADTIGDMLLKILRSDWGQALWSSMEPN